MSEKSKLWMSTILSLGWIWRYNTSFGLTDAAREVLSDNESVNKCSSAYGAGEWSGIGLSTAFGAAHLGRNAYLQMGVRGNTRQRVARGMERLISDPRGWGSVRGTWSRAAGNGQPFLNQAGQSLHHWLIPQRFGNSNGGFNYFPLTAGFNSWMNGSTSTRVAIEYFCEHP